MFKLVIADDEGKTTVVPLVRDEITIGRKEGNTIRLTERNISRKHAKLRRSNGSFMLEDLQSFNGVKVNGKKIGNETKLAAGDQILIGDYQLALQLESTDNSATLPEATSPTAAPTSADAVTAMIPTPVSPHGVSPHGVSPHGVSPMRGPPARLVMMSPPAPGAEYALSRDRMRIGRAEDLEIWVNHRSISREHAEVVLEDGVLRIKDMGSANGLRVNGADTRSHVLQPGDVVELGQVRFRYVPAGEAFTFDEGRTMQMEALAMPPEAGGGGNRTTMIVAGGILAIAVIAGAVIALSGSPDGPTATSIAPLPTTTVATPTVTPTAVAPADVVAPPAGPSLDARIATETAACQTSINSGNFADALAHASAALALRPDDAAAAACQDRATQEQAQSAAFVAGLAQLRNGELESAYLSFESLPVDSTYRQRPEVVDAMTRFATDTITQADALVSSNPTEASRLAEAVLNMVQAPPAMTERATEILRRTRPHVPIASARPRLVPPSHTTAVRPPPTTTAVRPPPTTTTAAPPPPTPPPTTSAAPPTDDALQRAIIAGDSREIIRLLGNGRAHGTAQLRALWNAQRDMSDRTGACVTVRQLLASPGVPPAQQAMMRQYQSAQCQ